MGPRHMEVDTAQVFSDATTTQTIAMPAVTMHGDFYFSIREGTV